jgi:hypothetical protein
MKNKTYSKSFERDYSFYMNNINNFDFCGTLIPKHIAIYSSDGVSAKEAFYSIDSNGKNIPTNEPDLLNKLLLCKAGVNFQIKQWAEGRAEGTCPLHELTGDAQVLEWDISNPNNPIAKYHKNITEQYGLPNWVLIAIEKQSIQLMKPYPIV